ncbi:hypothetical protein [Nocardiopsis metallicus]|uniref:Uncharacterized protein n=1 Tax=Nocardiopsis metallicus TaxID=179819 RepID=A0A840W3H3_9ACTN|nr:hypothetical protein [Nocardiopsis metallicus]MBB5491419.1 hypothetical protein [Nocardiopsis metallicus]
MGPLKNQVVTCGRPIYAAGRMVEMTGHGPLSVVELPARMWNVAFSATAGLGSKATLLSKGAMLMIGDLKVPLVRGR